MNGFWKSLTKPGLTRQVLVWFLLVSLVPLGVVSWISYQEAYNQLYHSAEKALHDLSVVQLHALEKNIEGMKVDIIQESNRLINSQFLNTLRISFKASGKRSPEFVESYQWAVLYEKWSSDLITFWKEHDYTDILLIDDHGNILFSVAGKNDLGKNLFKGPMAASHFSKAAEQSLTSGKVRFSDLEYYKPKNNILSGFMISPVVDETGNKIGLMAFQVAGDYLLELLLKKTDTHAKGVHYIIGEDLCLRSPNALGGSYPVLEKPVKTKITEIWRDIHLEAQEKLDVQKEQVMLYKGPHGRDVLGMHTDIALPGLHWAYIAEIDANQALAASKNLARLTLILIGGVVALIIVFIMFKTRRIVGPITSISKALAMVGKGDFQQEITTKADHELGNLVDGFNRMIKNLKAAEKSQLEQKWRQEGMNQLNDHMQGDLDIDELARNTIGFLCRHLEALTGAYYIADDSRIRMVGSFAFSARKGFRNEFSVGEGIVGQAALELQALEISDVPENYFAIESGLGEKVPTHIYVMPLIWNNKITLLLEFGTFKKFTKLQQSFLKAVSPAVSIAAQTALSRSQTRELLEKTQVQAEELQAREEELRDSNRLLERQAIDLKKSQKILQESQSELEQKNEQLKTQEEELRISNEELEEQTQDLKRSRHQVEMKNKALEEAQSKLEQRARELSISSKYKSEFLANMSHELRTPLNSLLILSRLMAENKEGNLNEKQVEFSNTIHDSGMELLNLINEILDLSKIEAGRMETNIETVHCSDFIHNVKRTFEPLARQKELNFMIETDKAPAQWLSDSQKLGQIVRNLLSNAFKFTHKGHVRLYVGPPDGHHKIGAVPGLETENTLIISVSDTGIGIPEDRKNSIFEAFQQVDGTTSRKYGGTGLGLTISREFAKLLGGDLHVESQEGKGSMFILYIPCDGIVPVQKTHAGIPTHRETDRKADISTVPFKMDTTNMKTSQIKEAPEISPSDKARPAAQEMQKEITDDRSCLNPEDRTILIIEDDMRFVRIMADLAKARGFKILVAEDGETGLHLADYYQPSGIVLDIGLPGLDGWGVMDRLKDNSRTRHIPVHFITASDFSQEAFKKGAIGFLTKPVSMEAMQKALHQIEHVIENPVKHLLIVEDDKNQQTALCELLGGEDIAIQTALSGAEAKKHLSEQDFDCIVLDYGLPDMNCLQLIEELYNENASLSKVPIIIYTGREMEPRERAMLDRYTQRLIIKNVHSEERLLDDTTLFLHRVENTMPESQQQILQLLHDREAVFSNRKALLVDDDMRNVFALSAILQEKQMQVIVAKNGVEAVEKLAADPDIDIVLMDIMMPEMDGYEATVKIRQQDRFRELPIIALTAKAMKGDRLKCIESGASDYLAKPVDTDKLLSMMRVWLYKK